MLKLFCLVKFLKYKTVAGLTSDDNVVTLKYQFENIAQYPVYKLTVNNKADGREALVPLLSHAVHSEQSAVVGSVTFQASPTWFSLKAGKGGLMYFGGQHFFLEQSPHFFWLK